MFFVLSKLLSFLISPFIWCLLCVLIYFLLRQKKKLRKKTLHLGFYLLLLFSNPFLFHESARLWEIPYTQKTELNAKYDIGIVLCGMVSWDKEENRLTFLATIDRLFQAIELYKEKKITKILITGGSGSLFEQDFKESKMLKKYLIASGVPIEDILIESESKNTYENAIYSARHLKAIGYPTSTRALLITSALHMRRSKACFDKAGLSCDTYSTNRISGPRRYYPEELIVPNAYALGGWGSLFHEIIGYMMYDMMGYI